MNLKGAREYLEQNKIEFVLAQFVDIHGRAKTKAVPARHLDMVVEPGAGFAGFAVWGLGMGPEGPDFMARGDLSTLTRIGWMPGFARIACDGYVNDEPYEFDSRVVCRRAIEALKKDTGYEVYTGLEPEFFLLKRDLATGRVVPANDTDVLDKPCYDYDGLNRTGPFLTELTRNLIDCGLDIYQIDHEDGNGQYEINFTYTDALQMADHFILFKMAATAIARRHDMICSFMPKPMSDRTGSGMHMHISLGRERKNAFHDDSDPNGLGISNLAYQFMAGIFKHAAALTAITCPSVNSYKRLVVGGTASGATWAPAHICYGNNNRTAMVRVCGNHLEIRSPDSAANPYLMTAAIVAAGRDGIRNALSPGKPADINLYETNAAQRREMGIDTLPQSLGDAIAALEADEVIQDGIGKALAREFIQIKKQELTDYHRHVSDWEVNRYLEYY
ncbi:MAG: type III glutamate--ammonia ligase [Acidobacteria bacterium]|nr:type III glutamate--ammonia ligase [Acidobacteriota bacterium]